MSVSSNSWCCSSWFTPSSMRRSASGSDRAQKAVPARHPHAPGTPESAPILAAKRRTQTLFRNCRETFVVAVEQPREILVEEFVAGQKLAQHERLEKTTWCGPGATWPAKPPHTTAHHVSAVSGSHSCIVWRRADRRRPASPESKIGEVVALKGATSSCERVYSIQVKLLHPNQNDLQAFAAQSNCGPANHIHQMQDASSSAQSRERIRSYSFRAPSPRRGHSRFRTFVTPILENLKRA